MLVCVTGGTGFVGVYSVAALVANGHRVRLFVRDPAVVPQALTPFGIAPEAVEAATGDVRRARRNCSGATVPQRGRGAARRGRVLV
jgi:uncharacterized protein YbjT (DUF2867 family)